MLVKHLFLTSLGLFCTALAQPPCVYEQVPAVFTDYTDWRYTLLDTQFTLDADYRPEDLVSVSEAGLTDERLVRELLIPDLKQMLADAAQSNLFFELQSAYRSYEVQAQTFDYWVEQEGFEAALSSSARAGHSEHQLGTAIDLRSKGGPAPWDIEDWATTPEGAWLAENAWNYGFVMSYPKGKRAQSCYIYEPWHYRYVGQDMAEAVRDSGLTLREYLWQMR